MSFSEMPIKSSLSEDFLTKRHWVVMYKKVTPDLILLEQIRGFYLNDFQSDSEIILKSD
jgi:hypothetical protein